MVVLTNMKLSNYDYGAVLLSYEFQRPFSLG